MSNNIKKYLLTSLTLGLIAGSGALLIAGTNMLTKDAIAKNEQKKIVNGLSSIFGYANLQINNEAAISESTYQYVEYVYYVSGANSGSTYDGFAFRTTGSNMYGKISLIIGFDIAKQYLGLSIITNEQTYASTLVDNYINPLNNNERALEDVSCGATYGAKLVRDRVNEAKEAANKATII